MVVILITAAVMAVALAVSLRQGYPPDEVSEAAPEACLEAVLDACGRGDVAAYLDAFTGDLRRQLEIEAAASRPPDRFAESLKNGVAELKASVTSDVQRHGDGEVSLLWERVFAGYNERYRVRLRRVREDWKILGLDRLDRGAPPIPYGTPVYEEAKEETRVSR